MISPKQQKILLFPYTDYDSIICDGAVRSGKTSIMMVAFVDWAMRNFSGCRFGICGKTVGSAKQNIVIPYMSMSYARKRYTIRWKGNENIMEVRRGNRINIFELFGGKDASSYMLIQGRTLAGVLLDEVVLMHKSFVQQAIARCSVDGSKKWFSCNPSSPSHWFYTEWIMQNEAKNALYLHFVMSDNPSLSEKKLKEYEREFNGVFYDRYVLGKWVVAEGLIYPMHTEALCEVMQAPAEKYVLSIDYGTQNAFSCGMWGLYDNVWIRVDEYYYSGRDAKYQKTDEEYADDLDQFTSDIPLRQGTKIPVIIDPSAASFIAVLRKRGRYKVRQADNAVLDGIRATATAMHAGYIKICRNCKALIKELQGYVWDEKKAEDTPLKVNDHACDEMRYFVKTMGIRGRKKAHTEYLHLWN